MYQNATREQIVTALRAGKSNTAISRELHADKSRVRQIRTELGIPAHIHIPQPLTLEEKWATFTQPADGSHLEWTGERGTASGTPILRYWPKTYSAAGIAFRIKHDREPKGHVIADCGLRHCIAPDHVDDETGRLTKRAELRHARGLAEPTGPCAYGHDQGTYGRFESDGRPYCEACKAEVKRGEPAVLAAREAVRVGARKEIADRLEAGTPEIQIARDLGVAPTTVRNVRESLGLPAPRRGRRNTYASLEDAFRAHIEEVDGGHVRWTGYVDEGTGCPYVCFRQRRLTVGRVAFTLRYGREPVGRALPGCGMAGCVAGEHLADRPMREANRRADRAFEAIFGVAS